LIVFALARLPLWEKETLRKVGLGVVAGVLIAFGALTFQQNKAWADSYALWQAAAEKNPDAFIVHQAVGLMHAARGRREEAARELQQAAKLRDNFAPVHKQAADALRAIGQTHEAVPHLRRWTELEPESAEAHHALGVALL